MEEIKATGKCTEIKAQSVFPYKTVLACSESRITLETMKQELYTSADKHFNLRQMNADCFIINETTFQFLHLNPVIRSVGADLIIFPVAEKGSKYYSEMIASMKTNENVALALVGSSKLQLGRDGVIQCTTTNPVFIE